MDSSNPTAHKRFKLSKKLLSGTYTIVPEATSNGPDYCMDVKPRTNPKMPFMFLFEGKRVIGSVRRPANSATFEIKPGNYADDGEWEPLQRKASREATWSASVPAGGETREVSWKGAVDVAVDGKTSGSTRPGYRLIDISDGASGQVLATFTPSKGLSKGGVLQLNVDWGFGFEHMVIMTFFCLYDRVSTEATDVIGRGAAGGF